jgi:hypothetical protein
MADCLPEDIDECVQYVRELVTAPELRQAEDNLVPCVSPQSCCQVSATFFRPLPPIKPYLCDKAWFDELFAIVRKVKHFPSSVADP